MMIIDNKFNFWDIVYLKTDPDQEKRIVTEMKLIGSMGAISILYLLSCGSQISNHYEEEISSEKDIVES